MHHRTETGLVISGHAALAVDDIAGLFLWCVAFVSYIAGLSIRWQVLLQPTISCFHEFLVLEL